MKLLITSSAEFKIVRFSLKLALFLKKKMNVDTIFTEDFAGAMESYKRFKINPIEIRKLEKKIPLQKMDLNYYNALNLDPYFLLNNNYQRYVRFHRKTFRHGSDEDFYPIDFVFVKNRFVRSLIGHIKGRIPPAAKIPIIIHAIIYYISKILIRLLELFPKNNNITVLMYDLARINDVATFNKEEGFGIIAKKVLQYYFIYRYILKKEKPDIVFIYNGSWASQTPIYLACERAGIATFMIENSSFLGYSHFDSEGIWFDGDINRRELHELTRDENQKIMDFISERTKNYARGIASLIENEKNAKEYKKIPEKFIFIPLQILDDTNNYKFSPLFNDMTSFVKAIIDSTPNGYDIILKRHPWDVIWTDPAYNKNLKEIRALIKGKKHIHLLRNINSHLWLTKAAALVTINSTMALENCYMSQAPTVIAGDMSIRGWGFTYDVNTIPDLKVKIKEAIDHGTTPEMKKKMIQWLYMYVFEHLVHGNTEAYLGPGKSFPEHFIEIGNLFLKELNLIKEKQTKGEPIRYPKLSQKRCQIDRSKLEVPKFF